MDFREHAALRSELRDRVRTLREELQLHRERLRALTEACRTNTTLLRRAAEEGPRLFARDYITIGEADLLVRQQTIRHSGGSQRLTPTEWQLLTYLLVRPGIVHSRAELAAGAWGAGFADRASEVEVYVSRLRRKLGPAGGLLETVRGRGYRLVLTRTGDITDLAAAVDGAGAAPERYRRPA
jgi:DNA-binding response OmpR family regulator